MPAETADGVAPSILTRLRFHLELWLAARLLPFQVGKKGLDAVLQLAHPSTYRVYSGLSPRYITQAVLRTTRHPWLMRDRRCLRQGLLGYRFLLQAGFCPELHFAIDRTSLSKARISAHCWVCLDQQPVLNDRSADMTTLFVYSDHKTGSTP